MIRFTSCMVPTMESLCREVAALAAERLGIRTHFVGDIPWQERERRFQAGMIDVIWICGLPYVQNWDGKTEAVSLIAAPVMSGPRYADRPIYYSDIVVRSDSSYRSFMDLRGRRFAYNEPRSHSGYNVVRYHLAKLGEHEKFFGSAVESGAHQRSIEWIVEGRVDASAIDSTVLELEFAREPKLADLVVSIETLGPSPMPPWIARPGLAVGVQAEIQAFLLRVHDDAIGSRVLQNFNCTRFVAVDDAHYDPIRSMAAEAETVRL